ncbi:HNH endonuclease [Acidovorax sp. LjRoot118]|uniref:GmrSD restriction endonuclease domain-containing protein n=1 Tax=Acidovorax sp. LjRoot118 TaxID=3342256 RepID=UPI003ED120B2
MREDFAATNEVTTFETVNTISLRDFTQGGLIGPSLRKPDFQRETNHWVPEQVVSLLECFVNGDLIPSVILWQSPTYLFVIDGGHRLSVIRAWVEDDYGDGSISQKFFGYEISADQKKSAARTRDLVAERVGKWQHYVARSNDPQLAPEERSKLLTAVSRGIPIQWVRGDADKAENSFFKINTKGTPLDTLEELLLSNRRKPAPIAARAIIRAGKGHRYWSAFEQDVADKIEHAAKNIHVALFDPELRLPVKTLELPLGGPKGVRSALQVLLDVILIAVRNQQGEPIEISDQSDDPDGLATVQALNKTLNLIKRLTGNDKGSLGLHPAVYYYGPTGRHSEPMFMGTVTLVAKKIANNDSGFFMRFTKVRAQLEAVLIDHKELIATILQKISSKSRIDRYAAVLDEVIKALYAGTSIGESDLVKFAGLDGKIITGSADASPSKFSDDSKSQVFIQNALASALKCPICNGYLDTDKSVSYDHIKRKEEGGPAIAKNLQLTHPYCNQSVKN